MPKWTRERAVGRASQPVQGGLGSPPYLDHSARPLRQLLRLAYFARGLDGLFLPPVPGCEAFALLRAGSPEELWSGDLVTPERAIVYRLRGHEDDPYPATGEVLRHSNVAQLLKKSQIGSLLLSSSFTPQVRAWANRNGIRVLAADYEQQQQLENKLWFDRFLTRHQIQKPKSAVVVAGSSPSPALETAIRPAVVQQADSMGGEGTFFLDSLQGWPDLAHGLALPRGERCLARQFVPGQPLGITVFVAPGLVALSAVRLQCYYPRRSGAARQLFAGVQWLPAKDVSPRLKRQINDVFRRLGEVLYRRRYFGFANFDFLADSGDQVWVIECNPRMSAATPQLLANPELSGGLPLGRIFLQGLQGPAKWPKQFELSPLPASRFAGATLDIASGGSTPQPVRREFACGRRPGEAFTLFPLAAKGQIAWPETTLATVLSDVRLYDAAGHLNAVGRRLVTRFRYT